jgi:hypothetical protein
MHVTVSRSIAAATSLALLLAPLTAMAQTAQVQVQVTPYQPQQPVYVQQVAPPPPADAQAGNGQYVAPLQQQTQQTYVPQSVALSGPRVIKDWHEGEPIPPGYHPATRVRSGLIAGGATMFGVPYLISALTGAIGADSGCCNAMFVPVVGPFIQMTQWHTTDASAVSTGDIFLVLDGALQATGVALFVYGIAVPKTVLLRNDLGVFKNVMATPLVAQNFTGVGISGQF